MNKKAYHPDGKHSIVFDEGPHTYTDNFGKIYTSATSFVGQFFEKFDAVDVSERCAVGVNPKYSGRLPEDIRAEWSAEGKRGQDEGTNVHEFAEGLMDSWGADRLPVPISSRCENIFLQVALAVNALNRKFQFVAIEMIVFSPFLGISGMIDLLMYDPVTNEIIILDHKQNKNAPTTENHWRNGLGPLDHLQDTDIAHYSLQLSLYQHLLTVGKYFPGISGYRRILIHLMPDSFREIELEGYDYEIMEMLKYGN